MKAISAKMCKAMSSIDAVVKKGKNQAQNYAYVKATDVANEVRAALNAAGIAFNYQVLSERFWDGTTKSGGVVYFCSLHVQGTFTDSESGECVSSSAIGWGADSQDKAPYKAMTGALKYMLRTTFLIPDESDPENDKHEEAHEIVPQVKLISAKQAEDFRKACTDTGLPGDSVKKALGSKGIKSSAHIPADLYSLWMEYAQGTAEVPA